MDKSVKIIAQFKSRDEEQTSGPPFEIPIDITPSQLELLINNLLKNEDELPYTFYVQDLEVQTTLKQHITTHKVQVEHTVTIVYEPQAVFRVRAVTRCTSSMPGHSEAILAVCFSPDGTSLASGSGDTTVRIWDIDTETPKFTCKAHKNWVLCVSFSPNGKYIVSGDMDGDLYVWDPATGNQVGSVLKGHRNFITGISWEPIHKNPKGNRFASSSKDSTVKVWDISIGRAVLTLSGHTASVTCLRWGGAGLIYTGSQDRTIKVYTAAEGKLCRTLEGHAHWVNSLALHTDHALRTGSFDHTGKVYEDLNEAQQYALERYNALRGKGGERLASGSDDFTIYLWDGENNKKPVVRLTGHQQPINLVSFSPDGRLIASASFDKSLKIWDAVAGKFKASLRGHVGAVYQVCWSSDSRMLVSGSKDSTVKLWDMASHSLKADMPGHADEVYSVDWSPDGQRVASGSKDRIIKLWRH